jgi:hypothetical protein
MDSGVKLAPAFHFYKDGKKIGQYVGDSYPALEVSPLPVFSRRTDERERTEDDRQLCLDDKKSERSETLN